MPKAEITKTRHPTSMREKNVTLSHRPVVLMESPSTIDERQVYTSQAESN